MDPRLAALYDADNPDGIDHDFFRNIAKELDATTILDVGCGTGILTVTLGGSGKSVYGVDPTPSMLAIARSRPGSDTAHWIDGTSSELPDVTADLAVMSGNVAMHIPDESWSPTLADIAQRLRPGGVLAFESRNPALRAWESWTSEPGSTRATPHGLLKEWMRLDSVGADGRVDLTAINHFVDADETVLEPMSLWFRSADRLRADLAAAGFSRVEVFSDWEYSPERADAPLFVITAVRG